MTLWGCLTTKRNLEKVGLRSRFFIASALLPASTVLSWTIKLAIPLVVELGWSTLKLFTLGP
jgi:hypothetical protein